MEKPPLFADRTLAFYEQKAQELAERYEKASTGEILRLLRWWLLPHRPVLELGCGTGRDMAQLLRWGIDVYALDGAAKMVELCQKCHPELQGRVWQQVLPSPLPLAPDGLRWGGAYALALLMHFSEREVRKVLEEVRQVLAEGAPFLFSVSLKRSQGGGERFFLCAPWHHWWQWAKETGWQVKGVWFQKDGLGRDFVWASFLIRKAETAF